MSNSNESSTPDTGGSRFSRGLVGRLIAVGLFLALGTFAVTQTLKGFSHNDVADKNDAEETDGLDPENEDSTTSDENTSQEKPELEINPNQFKTNLNSTPKTNLLTNDFPSRSTETNPKPGQFTQPSSRNFDVKAADTNPAINEFDASELGPKKKNLVAKPIVATTPTQEDTGGPPESRGFDSRPKMPIVRTMQDATGSDAPKTGGFKMPERSSFADIPKVDESLTASNTEQDSADSRTENSRDNAPIRGISIPKDTPVSPLRDIPQTNPASQSAGPSNRRTFELDPPAGNPLARKTAPNDTFQVESQPTASIDNARGLAPIRQSPNRQMPNEMQNAAPRQTAGALGPDRNIQSPTTDPVPSFANQQREPANNQFGGSGNRNLGNSANQQFNSSGSANPSRSGISSFPKRGQDETGVPPAANFANRPSGNNPNQQQGFAAQQNQNGSPVQRNPIPTRNASMARPIQPALSGIRTAPTPGEKIMEGSLTSSIVVQRIAPREIQLNTPATFEAIVRNVGKVEANDVRVYDRIPTGTRLLEATPQPTENDGSALQWDIGRLGPGQERRIKLKLLPTQPGEIGSVAHVTVGTRSSVRTLVTKPVLEITHTAPAKSLIGDNVPLDIVVTNKGNGPASNVIIHESIPRQLAHSDGFREAEYEVGTLAPGQSRKLQLILRAADVGSIRNVIHASGAGGLKAQHAVEMQIVAPKLVANSAGPRRRFLRREATHEFAVQNSGTAKATNVELMAKLSPGLKFVSANNRGQYDPSTNAVYWSLAQLDSGTTANVDLKTVPVATGNQDIEFTAVADLNQKVTASAGLLVEHLVDVFFDIDDVTDHIEIGSETQYQIRIVNQGTKTANNVRIQVNFSNGIRPTTVEGGLQSQVQGQQVMFAPITSMNPGDEIKVAINATGVLAGEHKIVANMMMDGREVDVSKEETTQVYADR